jgi:hypothetical protein
MADVETKQDLYDADFVAWADAQAMLARAEETGLMHLPPACPWTVEQILSSPFLPDGPARDG